MKKLLILGGARYIIPVIKTAQQLGIYVITCDYLPDNIAHKYSDKYCNVSIIDKDAVLQTAIENEIDGVMSFACDPGVVTAAYVAECLNLPFQASYEAATILQDKGKFRKFLAENNFNTPRAKSYSDRLSPYQDIDYFNWPVIVKPIDSAGSKGVTRADTPGELDAAISKALDNSLTGQFIVEEFLTFEGYHSSSDSFVVDGKLQFITYSDHMFDKDAANPYIPAVNIWPSTMKEVHQNYLTNEIQRLVDLLHLTTGIYNIETCVSADGKPYIMEVSPRGGGCKMAEIQELIYGIKFVENEIRKAVGMPLLDMCQTPVEGVWCVMVLHAAPGQEGYFNKLQIDDAVKEKNIKVIDMTAKKGDKVLPFTGANMSLGDMFLKFDSRKELEDAVGRSAQWMKIVLEDKQND